MVLLAWGTFGAALVLAVLDWVAVWQEDRQRRYATKPVAMAAVIMAAALLVLLSPHDPWQAAAFLVGFGFSFAGDVFLLVPNQRMFLPGLVAFLLAHVCYIVGLNRTLPPLQSLWLALPLVVVTAIYFLQIRRGLVHSRHSGLVPAVAIYCLVISIMLWSAWATLFRPVGEWPLTRQALVISGATLFFISDGVLAWNRFVRRLQFGDLAVMITYHLGQIALAASLAVSAG